jgi:methionyl-tRNA formyltransferase
VNLIFFGSPDFAVPSLERLAAEPGVRVTLVVSQPDRKVGRGGVWTAPPVAAAARRLGIPLLQPETIRGAEFAERLRREKPELIAVVAYGKLLPSEILAIPRLGCVNVHASLLPRHRGASPIQGALLAGDRHTGVTTMRMTEGLDAGPVLLHRHVEVREDDDAGSLSKRLADEGAALLAETVRGLSSADLEAVPQEGEATYSGVLRRSDGEIDWKTPAGTILRAARAYSPWPGLFTFLGGGRVKIISARAGPIVSRVAPGETVSTDDGFAVACGGGTSIVPLRLQREGRGVVTNAEFFRGLAKTARFGR